EVLRQPLEDGVVTVSRANVKATYPARPLVVAAMNPCPCGYFGSGDRARCTCAYERVKSYRARLSGPLLDRIDVHVLVEPVDGASLQSFETAERTSVVRERVQGAREIQRSRRERGEVDGPHNAVL